MEKIFFKAFLFFFVFKQTSKGRFFVFKCFYWILFSSYSLHFDLKPYGLLFLSYNFIFNLHEFIRLPLNFTSVMLLSHQGVMQPAYRDALVAFRTAKLRWAAFFAMLHAVIDIELGRYQYLESVSVFDIFVSIFLCRFGIRYRYFEIPRYSVSVSVFLKYWLKMANFWYPTSIWRPCWG